MNIVKKYGPGFLLCLLIAVPSRIIGGIYPVAGGPIIAMLAGMLVILFMKKKGRFESGIQFTSKKVLQFAVVLLGFGLNLTVIFQTGMQSLPIIVGTITISLLTAFLLHKRMRIPANISILIGVGSSICGGSAVAATAPVINADDDEIAQAISVIFFLNVLAAILFPPLGTWLGFSTTSGEAFGIFAGTAINDTSSVTAAASVWDNMFHLGSATLDKAVTVKLTRTLAIIPITAALAVIRSKEVRENTRNELQKSERLSKLGILSHINLKNSFPRFILFFVLASVITTILTGFGIPASLFSPLKELSKFLVILAMAAIGLNTHIGKLIKTGGKPFILGLCCWIGITGISLLLQHFLGIWK